MYEEMYIQMRVASNRVDRYIDVSGIWYVHAPPMPMLLS